MTLNQLEAGSDSWRMPPALTNEMRTAWREVQTQPPFCVKHLDGDPNGQPWALLGSCAMGDEKVIARYATEAEAMDICLRLVDQHAYLQMRRVVQWDEYHGL